MAIRINVDVSIDQNDPERFEVVEYTRRGFSVLFRGTHEDCRSYVRGKPAIVEWLDADGDWRKRPHGSETAARAFEQKLDRGGIEYRRA